MLKKVKLYGDLAEVTGHKEFEVAVNSTAQAVSFLINNFPKLESYMANRYYRVLLDKEEIDTDQLHFPVGKSEIKFVPVVQGAGGNLGKILLGGALIAVSMGAFGAFGAGAISFGSGGGGFGGGSSGGGDKSIVCTEIYRQTQLADWSKAMRVWDTYQRRYLTPEHEIGYHWLFRPYVSGMKKSNLLTRFGALMAGRRTQHLKHVLTKGKAKDDLFGNVFCKIIHPTVYMAGKIKNFLDGKTKAT